MTRPSHRRISDPATVLAWAGTPVAPATRALFDLDTQLGMIVRTTTEPLVGQMRLTWWHDALTALDAGPPPAHPLLTDLAASALPRITGAALATMTEGWEVLIDPDTPDDEALFRYADSRGGTLFAALADAQGSVDDQSVRAAGRGWALADLAANTADDKLATRVARAGLDAIARLREGAWPRRCRAVAALTRDARLALGGRGGPDGPRRALGVLALLAGR